MLYADHKAASYRQIQYDRKSITFTSKEHFENRRTSGQFEIIHVHQCGRMDMPDISVTYVTGWSVCNKWLSVNEPTELQPYEQLLLFRCVTKSE